MRLSYPTNIRIIKVPCTGRVSIIHLMKAFEKGADGVFVAGCLEGDCHFQSGNLRAKKRVGYVKKLLESIGVAGDRIAMYNLSAGMGPKFAEIAREMTEKIRELGPFLKKSTPGAESAAPKTTSQASGSASLAVA
jgi:F420-non-reducing hydrogenase iron-sulfur subunit